MSGTCTSNDNRSINRGGDGDTLPMQKKLHISLNNTFYQDEAGHIGTVLNRNPVSTGLKLSYEEEERDSSVTCTCKNMKSNVPVMLSLGNIVKMEIDRQTEDFSLYQTSGMRMHLFALQTVRWCTNLIFASDTPILIPFPGRECVRSTKGTRFSVEHP